jgi:hypothetical protein
MAHSRITARFILGNLLSSTLVSVGHHHTRCEKYSSKNRKGSGEWPEPFELFQILAL